MERAIKLKLILAESEQRILDGQSKICNWLYNHLLQTANDLRAEYRDNQSTEVAKILYTKRGLRNLIPSLKKQHLFLTSVHSSPLKNAALQLSQAIQGYQKSRKGKRLGKVTGWPRFRSQKQKPFSLLYDEPGKGFKLDGYFLLLSLGKDENGKRLRAKARLEVSLESFGDITIKNLRIKREASQYFAIFTVTRTLPKTKPIKKLIALDPNHKNLAYGYDDQGQGIEIQNPWFLKSLQKRINQVKARRDKCLRKSIRLETAHGTVIYLPSRRWKKFNAILENLYRIRREQTKTYLYSIANWLYRHYDLVSIGDYTPRGGGISRGMRRQMNNESLVGRFKNILSWVALRSGKSFYEWDESGSTKTCSTCQSKREGLNPSIRVWQCEVCGENHLRDENAAKNGFIRTIKQVLPGSGHLPEFSGRCAVRYSGLGLVLARPGISVG